MCKKVNSCEKSEFMCKKVNSCVQKWISMNSLFYKWIYFFIHEFMCTKVNFNEFTFYKWIHFFIHELTFLFMNSLFTHELTFKHMNSLFYIWIPLFAHEFTFVHNNSLFLDMNSLFTSARTLRSHFLYVCMYVCMSVTLIKSFKDEKVNFKMKSIF